MTMSAPGQFVAIVGLPPGLSPEDRETLQGCRDIGEEINFFLPIAQRCLLDAAAPFAYAYATDHLKAQVAARLTAALRLVVLQTRYLQHMEFSWVILPSDVTYVVNENGATALEVSFRRVLDEVERMTSVRVGVPTKTKHFYKKPPLLGALLFRPVTPGIDEIVESRAWHAPYSREANIIRRMCRVRAARAAGLTRRNSRVQYARGRTDVLSTLELTRVGEYRSAYAQSLGMFGIMDRHWRIWAEDTHGLEAIGDKKDDHDYNR